jgi:hypothetical protein
MFDYRKHGSAHLFEFKADETGGREKWTAVKVSFEKVAQHLTPDTVYIVNGRDPSSYEGRPTLLVTSPRDNVYKEYCKGSGVRCAILSVSTVEPQAQRSADMTVDVYFA